MKSKLAIAVSLSGWILLVAYIFYDYVVYDDQIISHFFQPPYRYELFFHILIAIAPFISTVMGYLVNKRIELLKSVKESEKKYHDLYQNAPDGYHSVVPDGTLLFVNDTWLKMFGYERTEVEGRMNLKELLTDEGLKGFEKNNPLLKEKGCIENIEVDIRKKDGTFLPVIINATAVFDEKGNFLRSRTTVRDNTIKKGYQQILERASEEWKATFDSMPYGVMLLDSECNIIRTNKYISDLSGLPFRELISKKCYDVIHHEGKPPEGCPLEKSVKSKNTETLEYYEPLLNKHFMLSITPVFDEEGITIAYVHSIIDITDLKGKEKKLIESRNAFLNMLKDETSAYREQWALSKKLEVSNEDLQNTLTKFKEAQDMIVRSEKLASIGTLASGVAHEILNPLNIMSAIVQVLKMESLPQKMAEDLDEVMNQINRATKITNDLRTFAHQKKTVMSHVDIHNIFDRTASLIEHAFTLDNIVIERAYDKNIPLIYADEDRLAQIFLNLLNNARDAMKGRKNNIINVKTTLVENGMEIRFSDNGPGIPEKILDKIFNPFFTTKDPGQGTGLGLSLVYSMIENHGGTIHAKSEEGKGATFIIFLPANKKTTGESSDQV
ncbi:MAG: ATP-binding protein [Thermodesulfovibrionales bacterium]